MKRSHIIPLIALQVLAIVMAALALTKGSPVWYLAAYASAILLFLYVALVAYQYFFRSE